MIYVYICRQAFAWISGQSQTMIYVYLFSVILFNNLIL